MKSAKREKGIAIILVLSALLLLTSIVVDFTDSSQVSFSIAMNQRDRQQAYGLALSGLSFAKVVLKYDKDAKQVAKKMAKDQKLVIPAFYKMIPINTALMRTLASLPPPENAPENAVPPPPTDELKNGAPIGAESAAKDFLNFEGDFEVAIELEDGKFPLNAFYSFTPAQPQYDRLKLTLVFLLEQKPFESFFKDRDREARQLAANIADYIDGNESANDWGGTEKGSELTPYSGTVLSPKNARLISVEELIFVPGMTRDLLDVLKKYVTVYKVTDKINGCETPDELFKALMMAYTQNRNDVDPLLPDQTDRVGKLFEKLKPKCSDGNEMNKIFNEALGITNPSPAPAAPPTQTPVAGRSPETAPKPGSAPASGQQGFAGLFTDEEVVFVVQSTGRLGSTQVQITSVLEAASPVADQWKTLSWRVQ